MKNKLIDFILRLKNIKFEKEISSLFIFTFLLCIINSVALIHKSSSQKIVIFDRDLLFKDYYQSIRKISEQSNNISQEQLDKKNEIFIKAMLCDLRDYQVDHNVIVVKRSSLAAPLAFDGTKTDITKIIEEELKKQGVIE